MAKKEQSYQKKIREMRGSVKPSGEYMQKYPEEMGSYKKSEDTRDSSLRSLDAPMDELNKTFFFREKGSFDSKEEKAKEDDAKYLLEESELPPERKKLYLQLLKKRMRTA